MSEVDPGASRVSVEVSGDELPSFLSYLGGFAINRSLNIQIDPIEDVQPEKIVPAEATPYNSQLVTWVADKETGNKIAIVTNENISATSLAKDYTPIVRGRHTNAIYKATTYRRRSLRTADYVYEDPETEEWGLVVDKIPELVDRLSSGDLEVSRIGVGAIEFFRKLHAEVTTEN